MQGLHTRTVDADVDFLVLWRPYIVTTHSVGTPTAALPKRDAMRRQRHEQSIKECFPS